ncbi:hypothetical protein HOY80DRAFT_950669 [Tuber brumale]|nr:hypothetical protein HOY80DRAFT_950669 [Tuber brumale]
MCSPPLLLLWFRWHPTASRQTDRRYFTQRAEGVFHSFSFPKSPPAFVSRGGKWKLADRIFRGRCMSNDIPSRADDPVTDLIF